MNLKYEVKTFKDQSVYPKIYRKEIQNEILLFLTHKYD